MNVLWYTFKMNKMGADHEVLLKTDIFLLADAFENFIYTCLEQQVLDLCHYFSSPEVNLDVTVKMTEI